MGSAFRGTMVVRPGSWHGRLYRYWERNAKFKVGPSYRENLCHYSRVVVIWAPLMLFSQVVRRIGDFFSRTVKIGGGGSGGQKRRFMRPSGRLTGIGDWFAEYGFTGVCMVMATAGIISLVVWSILNPLEALWLFLQTVLMVAITGGGMIGVSKLGQKLKQSSHRSKGRPIRDTVQLVGHMVVAKKQGICPFIEFADDEGLSTGFLSEVESAAVDVPTIEVQDDRVLEPV